MDSTVACALTTVPAANASLQSSGAPSPASSNKLQEMTLEFKCALCPRTFKTAHGRGSHQKAHRDLRQAHKIQKEQRRLVPAGPQAYFDFHTHVFNSYGTHMPSSARSGVVPLFAGTSELATAQPSLAVSAGGGHVGSGALVGIFRQVNLVETGKYYSWLCSTAVPVFVSQTGSTSGVPEPLFAAPEPVEEGDGGSGQQDMPKVNQEDNTDFDLTLRL